MVYPSLVIISQKNKRVFVQKLLWFINGVKDGTEIAKKYSYKNCYGLSLVNFWHI